MLISACELFIKLHLKAFVILLLHVLLLFGLLWLITAFIANVKV